MARRSWIGSIVLLTLVLATGAGLALWKRSSLQAAEIASSSQPEPMEMVTAGAARRVKHVATTTSIGTVVALRSITLRNEVAGTVATSALVSGQIVEAGAVLVTLDVSVEEAELKALEAQAALADTWRARVEEAKQSRAAADSEVDRARAERDVAAAQIARTKAIIARKTIKAPFRARVGISDVHAGQFLDEGTTLTTLQGVDSHAYVDFAVAQRVAAGLRPGQPVEVFLGADPEPAVARIVAVDARVDPATRNAVVRAKFPTATEGPAPGASVRVRVPTSGEIESVAVAVTALRKGPQGEHVFVLSPDAKGGLRAHQRAVKSGPVLGDEILIEEGLKAGEQVAASGSFKLMDGGLVALAGEPGKN